VSVSGSAVPAVADLQGQLVGPRIEVEHRPGGAVAVVEMGLVVRDGLARLDGPLVYHDVEVAGVVVDLAGLLDSDVLGGHRDGDTVGRRVPVRRRLEGHACVATVLNRSLTVARTLAVVAVPAGLAAGERYRGRTRSQCREGASRQAVSHVRFTR
jgi:hypothetical protein